jgi:DNA-binding PadR family transcriptional regulator
MNDSPEPRLSPKEFKIMQLLIANGELFGQELVKRSDGELARGTVYVTLSRLEDKGFLCSREEERHPGAIGLPRRLYKSTGLGQRVFEAVELARAHMAFAFGGGR